jgi:transposase
VERIDWLPAYARVTKRMAESVARLCKVLSIKHVAEYFGLCWDAVKAIDKAAMETELGQPDCRGVTILLMDEFALRKGHRYATVVMDGLTKRVLWVGKGRSREEIRPFFQLLGKEGCRQIQAVGVDMSAPFEGEIRARCPQAEIVFDLFHVVMRYGREVIDRVRIDEANRLKADKATRKVVKGAKWLLLRNWENLPDEDAKIRLNELLEANQALMTVYLLKDDLKQLWDYKREGWARRTWNDWLDRARSSGIAPLKRFAENLAKRLEGILAHCRYPIHTSLIEGVNNKIKLLKRIGYGYRDDAYFFLKIRAAFPGIPG